MFSQLQITKTTIKHKLYLAGYSLLLYALVPFLLFRLWMRGRKLPAYRKRVLERFAYNLPKFKAHGIWIHAVSVGETIAAKELIFSLMQIYPHLPITVTCTTPTGSQTITKLFGNKVQHCYLPYDLPYATQRFVAKLQPQIAIMLETEIWPNLINICSNRNIKLMIANGRMSQRSYCGYLKFKTLVNFTLQQISLIAAQTTEDAKHFIQLGAISKQVVVTGSIKFDFTYDENISTDAQNLRLKWQAQNRPIWIAASTHQGEDAIILKAHLTLLKTYANALLVLVPRHIERTNDIVQLANSYDLTCVLRSSNLTPTAQTQVFIGNSIGELLLFYALSDIAFVGGSLIAHGGHNMLEPAAFKLPLLAGVHNFNFADITRQMLNNNGLTIVNNANDLSANLISLFKNNTLRTNIGLNAFDVLQQNKGALNQLLSKISSLIN